MPETKKQWKRKDRTELTMLNMRTLYDRRAPFFSLMTRVKHAHIYTHAQACIHTYARAFCFGISLSC